ncbi:VacJ family lipoprotein [Telluria mixta]|uniref:VacJ family lipoprotein n=1 Tax=Telluria mixta TaxID=34071 RepID=A0ABT2C6C8_9BURK|nr:VacJ family lipoprotein [Telluria mixta]MCS0632924.1 VacJ family lipoprotein [Telluria mixta]WEM97995.1 VacJ family lipoprotein [Telluria mixta]
MTNRNDSASPRTRTGLALALGAAVLLSGCATTANPKDPFEKFNRAMFSFNDTVDRVALKPAATAYKNVTPTFVQTGVNNFFGNLTDLWSSLNNFAQLKGQDGLNDFMRFAVNSTLGLAGVLDIATPAGMRKHNEDFGQTLGYWGVPSGPYLMLPLLGPSTIRDTATLPADWWGDAWTHVNDVPWRTGGIVLRAVDQRASVLDASNLLEDAALDRYEFIRDGYMQRRNSKVLDTDKAQERADKVHEKLEKVQEKVESKLGVKLGPKPVPEDGAEEPAAAPAEGSAPNNPPVPAPVSSEPASK